MRSPIGVKSLEALGRERLSKNFFMRDFLYSEISNFHGQQNIPENPDLAIRNGRKLCEDLLEPLHQTSGRIAIRSAYRSASLNDYGEKKGSVNCASNENNFAAHIWDRPDLNKRHGAMACIVVPWFLDKYEAGTSWKAMAYWIHNHLPYHRLEFFGKLCAFNIGWRDEPERQIINWIDQKRNLLHGEPPDPGLAH